MSVDAGVLVGRRSRAEIERLVALYGSSGMSEMLIGRQGADAEQVFLGLHTMEPHTKGQSIHRSPCYMAGARSAHLNHCGKE